MTEESINETLQAMERVSKEALKSKESAIKFLQDAGILDENGELAERFRDIDDTEENDKN